ncbi:hypothetical protein XELAEV_18001187mg [Xenopus laevis]|nr:hypothetical protein XELAEV_18001187mg [Xenopus laevis]
MFSIGSYIADCGVSGMTRSKNNPRLYYIWQVYFLFWHYLLQNQAFHTPLGSSSPPSGHEILLKFAICL